MHQNLFIITPDLKKYILNNHVPGGLAGCKNASEFVFILSRLEKTFFIIPSASGPGS
jgi:hypothetical protein